MKRKYIKPSIINYFLLSNSALLAGSGGSPGNEHNIESGGAPGGVSGGIGTGNGGETLSKHYNAWEAWDEF